MKGLDGKTPNKRALYRNQDETLASTVYHEYPRKPFINDDYVHSPDKPTSLSPENNRKGICFNYMYILFPVFTIYLLLHNIFCDSIKLKC